jgi:hypothetical protein
VFNFIDSKVVVAVVDALELAAINSNAGFRQQIQLSAEQDKLATDFTDHCVIVFTKVGNRFKVRHQPTGQPKELYQVQKWNT